MEWLAMAHHLLIKDLATRSSHRKRISHFEELLALPVQGESFFHIVAGWANSWRCHSVFQVPEPESQMLMQDQWDNVDFSALFSLQLCVQE